MNSLESYNEIIQKTTTVTSYFNSTETTSLTKSKNNIFNLTKNNNKTINIYLPNERKIAPKTILNINFQQFE